MPAANNSILCMATSLEDEPLPLFVGREDGNIEKYISIADADLGQPSCILRGHRKAVTGIVAISSEEIYSCSLDCTIKQWNADVAAEGKRSIRSIDAPAALRCLVMSDGRLFAGGEDGCLHVVDGDRQSIWKGHVEAITCVAVSLSGLVVTGGTDNHVIVWDPAVGKPIRRLLGHRNPITCLCVVPGDEDEGEGSPLAAVSDGAILSFSSDRTMKVWALPFLDEDEQDDDQALDDEDEDERRATQAVSFQEPVKKTGSEEDGEEDEVLSPGEADPDGPVVERNGSKVSFDAGSNQVVELGEGLEENPDEVPISDIINNVATKSAMKVRPKRPLRRSDALGTFELPEVPHILYQPEESPLAYVGATGGYVWAIKVASIARTVLRFVAQNRMKVRQDVRATRQTLTKSVALMKKECRRDVKKETKKLIRAARRAHEEKKKKEREEKRKEREALAAERAARRAAREDEEDEEDFEEDDEEEDFDEEEDEMEEEEDEEEEDEEGVDRLRLLSPEQRETLETFIKTREAQRDTKMNTLKDAVAAHLAKVEPLAVSTYDRARDQFYRLKGTAYANIGPNSVKSLVCAGGHVYASQGCKVLVTDVTPGVTRLT